MDSSARFIALMGGTGGGKTWWGPIWMYNLIAGDVARGVGKGAKYLAVARTYAMASDTLIPLFREHFDGTPLQGHWHEQKGRYELPTGGTVFFKSGDKPHRIEGIHARGAWLDEPSEMPALIWVIIQSRVGLYTAPVLFTGYPTNMGWYYDQVFRPWEEGDHEYDVIQFDSTENPMYSAEEMARAKRVLPAWLYDMRYRGLFRKPAGLIYPTFGTHQYVEPFDIPDDWPSYATVDPGLFYGAVFMAWHEGVYYQYDEYSTTDPRSAQAHADQMRPKIKGSFLGWMYDPARKTDILNLIQAGLGPFYKANNAVNAGIETTLEVIGTDRWKIMRGKCPSTVDQFSKYKRPTDPGTGEVTSDKPLKKDDEMPDCVRYMFHTLESAPLKTREVVVASLAEEISSY